uniref:Amino acid adenylation domain n=1 Tax=Marinomonas sp. (strain MWYL1) TaxID=400668 RepID=A6VYF6_MARMS
MIDTECKENKNDFRYQFPKNVCVHQLFEQQVERSPEKTALVFGDEELSYGALNASANCLARRLLTSGVGSENLVGLYVDRSFEMIIGLLAILKAGAAYVPLDPEYPAARIEQMLEDCLPSKILVSGLNNQHLSEEIETISIPAVLDEYAQSSNVKREELTKPITQSNLAYVIYTSGSTGKPKGVLIEHEGLVNLVQYQRDEFLADDTCRVLQFTSISFDAAVFEWTLALCNGGTLFLVSRDATTNPRELERIIKEYDITHTNLVPSVLRNISPSCFSRTAYVISAGEALPEDVRSKFAKQCNFYNGYGPTEVTVASSYCRIDDDNRSVSIGKPLSNKIVYVVDESRKLVESGEVGELLIGGVGISRGYLGREDLTKEKFISDPFNERGGRVYCSGDLVKWLPDGNLQFIGRADEQVKIRGFRIELGEIEKVIRKQADVKDVIVTTIEGINGRKHLKAYVVTDTVFCEGGESRRRILVENCKVQLEKVLPEHMIPGLWSLLSGWPLLINGKIDRKKLQELELIDVRKVNYLAPSNEIERRLCEIFSSVLKVESVGINDNFFYLGGDSITAGIILHEIGREYGVEIKLNKFFENPEVSELTLLIKNKSQNNQSPGIVPRPNQYRNKIAPSSFQKQILFMFEINNDDKPYHAKSAINFYGKVDLERLDASIRKVVKKHEIYRTGFHNENDDYVQKIVPEIEFDIPVFNLLNFSLGEKRLFVEDILNLKSIEAFDIERAPLTRWVVLKLSEELTSLLYIEHHLVHDGWSYNIFLQDLFREYNDGSLCLPSLQYGDFVLSHEMWMYSEQSEDQLKFWEENLKDSPQQTTLPSDWRRQEAGSEGKTLRIAMNRKAWQRLDQLSIDVGVTKFNILLTAMYILIFSHTKAKDLLLGTGAANRSWKDSNNIIGMFVNSIVIRNQLDEDCTVEELIKKVSHSCLEAFDNDKVAFESVVERINPLRAPKVNPFFQIMLAFHDSVFPDINTQDAKVRVIEALENGGAKFDMTVVVIPRKGQYLEKDPVHFVWNYNTGLYRESTVKEYIEQYFSILQNLVEMRSERVIDLQRKEIDINKIKESFEYLPESFLEWCM